MFRKSNLILWSFLLLVVLFVGAIFLLFSLRFSSGDIFPPYSSLRSDPLGSKALFLALQGMQGVKATRHYQELSRLKEAGPATMLLLGLAPDNDSDDSRALKELKDLASGGNRIVLAFRPVNRVQDHDESEQEEEEPRAGEDVGKKDQAKNDDAKKDVAKGEIGKDGVKKDENNKNATKKDEVKRDPWWPEVKFYEADQGEIDEFEATLDPSGGGNLPGKLRVHTQLYFAGIDGWNVLYSVEGRPVLMERMVGKGSVVLVADSFIFSNEAMRNYRQPALISRIIDGNRKVVFDESHLGVYDSRGIMTLVKKYRLVPLLLVLGVLMGLYIWHNAVSLVPAVSDAQRDLQVQEKDHFTGFVNLLRRSVPRGRLLQTCFSEWKRSFARQHRDNVALLERVENVVVQNAAEPATAYKKVTTILAEKRGKTA